MKQIIFIIFFSLIFCLNLQAQDALEISQITPCPVAPKLTKSELKRIKQLAKDVTHIYDSEPLKIFVGVENKILADGKKVTFIKSQINSFEAYFKKMDNGNFVTELNFFMRITPTDKRSESCFEEKIKFSLKKEEIGKKTWLNYNKIVELAEGKYAITFVGRDIQTGVLGIEKISFEVN